MTDLSKPITEQQFCNSLLQWATRLGWRCFHVRTSGRMHGLVAIPTVQGVKGFPDLVLAKAGRLIFAELKASKGKLHAEQVEWLAILGSMDGVECYVWRPKDWTQIIVVLTQRAGTNVTKVQKDAIS